MKGAKSPAMLQSLLAYATQLHQCAATEDPTRIGFTKTIEEIKSLLDTLAVPATAATSGIGGGAASVLDKGQCSSIIRGRGKGGRSGEGTPALGVAANGGNGCVGGGRQYAVEEEATQSHKTRGRGKASMCGIEGGDLVGQPLCKEESSLEDGDTGGRDGGNGGGSGIGSKHGGRLRGGSSYGGRGSGKASRNAPPSSASKSPAVSDSPGREEGGNEGSKSAGKRKMREAEGKTFKPGDKVAVELKGPKGSEPLPGCYAVEVIKYTTSNGHYQVKFDCSNTHAWVHKSQLFERKQCQYCARVNFETTPGIGHKEEKKGGKCPREGKKWFVSLQRTWAAYFYYKYICMYA